jgi:hypothetical protein
MADSRAAQAGHEVVVTWRRLGFEQRVAGLAALLLIVSTFGPFSFVEAAELLTGLGVLALLRARALGKRFHLPFGDGSVIMAAGGWAGLLIVIRLFDRPLGQNLLALVCAALLALAGLRESAKRPADDLPADAPSVPPPAEPAARPREEEPTRRLPAEGPAAGRAPATPAARATGTPPEQLTLPEPPDEEPELGSGGGADASGESHQDEAGGGGEELDRGRDQDRLG